MIKKNQIFNNLFDSKLITPTRLLQFGWAVHAALASANSNGLYTAILAKLLAALTALKKEITDVASNLNKQKNSTLGVNAFIAEFIAFMLDNEYVIARAVGGRDTDAYRTFYPFGKAEYTLTNKTSMTPLTTRVENAAFEYATGLGTELASQLQGFAPGYTNAVTAQRLLKKHVRDYIADKTVAFVQVQWALTGAVHTVAAVYADNISAAAAMFPFDMLFVKTKHKVLNITGKLAKGEAKKILNRTLNTGAVISVRNTGTNASVVVWLAANPTDAPPADAKVISANNTENIKATALGNLKNNSFLMVKNVSDVNEGSFEIEISRLSKLRSEEEDNSKDMIVVRA